MGKVVDGYDMVPDGKLCRPLLIDNRADFTNGGLRIVSWAFRDKDLWKDFDALSGKEALGKWELETNE